MRLAARLVAGTTLVLAGALLATGVATGGVLYRESQHAQDEALLAAAHSYGESGWHTEHERDPIAVVLAPPGEPGVPEQWLWDLRERPVFHDLAGERILLMPVESNARESEQELEAEEDHRVIVARTPAVGVAEAVGSFAIAYGLASLVVLGVAGIAQRAFVRTAVAPIEIAAGRVATVVGAGSRQQIPEDGPDEVRGLLVAVNALLVRLDGAFQAQSRFTAEAAHELRTPVAAMLGTIDVALRRPRSAEEHAATLASVREDVVHLAELVDALLVLTRVDAGQAERERRLVRAGEIVDAALGRERRTLEVAGNTVTVELVDDPELEANEALAITAVANLLRNAAVHAPGSAVTVTVDRDGRSARIVVQDRGPGVAPAERDAVFERLVRGARSRTTSGLGLGLTLAREIARRHGGDCVFAEPVRGQGARVVLSFAAA